MNPFDTGILDVLNHLAHRWPAFDRAIFLLSAVDLLKGGVIMTLLWGAWYSPTADVRTRRSYLLSALVAGFVAVVAARGLAHLLPFRVRPLMLASYHFTVPYGDDPLGLRTWSSLPSDHAALFFAIGMGLLFACRPSGVVALLYAAFAICLPRLYLGVHWPTDVLAGATLGVTVGWLATRPRWRDLISQPLLRWHDGAPGSFYACLFLATYQTATLWSDLRWVGSFIFRTLTSSP
jgi:membrane-associated phospholipid phosphatase